MTDMAFVDGKPLRGGAVERRVRLEAARSVPYPFTTVDNGTSVEIYHGAHGAFETRSPVYAFVPYTIDNTPHLIAGYLCTPLVKFPLSNLEAGRQGAWDDDCRTGQRQSAARHDRVQEGRQDFLLMSNTSRGVMKIPTADFGKAEGITSRRSPTRRASVRDDRRR